jgi:hypothetical protein
VPHLCCYDYVHAAKWYTENTCSRLLTGGTTVAFLCTHNLAWYKKARKGCNQHRVTATAATGKERRALERLHARCRIHRREQLGGNNCLPLTLSRATTSAPNTRHICASQTRRTVSERLSSPSASPHPVSRCSLGTWGRKRSNNNRYDFSGRGPRLTHEGAPACDRDCPPTSLLVSRSTQYSRKAGCSVASMR